MWEKIYEKGVDAIKRRDYIKAVEHLAEAKTGFLITGNKEGENLAKRDLGRTYLYLNRYTDAKDIFVDIVNNTDDSEVKSYAMSRLGIISAEIGDYQAALDIYASLPDTVSNLINTAMLHYHIAFFDGKQYELDAAERILLELKSRITLSSEQKGRVFNILGMILQLRKDYGASKRYYEESIRLTEDNEIKARRINDLAGLYVETGKLLKAEDLLDEASLLISEKDALALAYNYKWRGMIAIEENDFEKAAGFYKKTANIVKEKGIFRQIAEILHALADKMRGDFHESSQIMAEAILYRRKSEEVMLTHEKIHDLLDSVFDVD